VQNYKFKVP